MLLKHTALSSVEDKQTVDCIVSLTSIPSRLNTLHITILSLFAQSVLPKKIVLWLNEDLKTHVPKKLKLLQNDIFEIRYKEQTSSHRKLVFSLLEFDKEIIVTCDDDLIYPSNWLSSLFTSHQMHPDSIVANECREIVEDSEGHLKSYVDWPTATKKGYTSKNLLPIGYGGVLYPAGCLHKDVTNSELYLQLSPKADDLWFKAMSLINQTKVYRSDEPPEKPIPIIGAKKSSLADDNIKKDMNRVQWQAIIDHYKISLNG
jgi:hypothetical protein